MRDVIFYKTSAGHQPVAEFLNSLDGKQAQKVAWVLQLIEELDIIPKQYFKKLEGADNIWEVRVQQSEAIAKLPRTLREPLRPSTKSMDSS
jgi:hypothetical protein